MKRQVLGIVATLMTLCVAVVACSQPTATSTPTKAPAAPTAATGASTSASAKAAEPTKPAAPAAAAPTAAPAKAISYPEKGKTIELIVPWAAGSVNDVIMRLVAPYLEQEIGTSIQLVNKAGAGSQTGITEVAKAKPDGYTIVMNSMPTTIILYVDPERKAAFTRKDIQPVAVVAQEPMVLSVKADSPYKSVKDLVDAAKAAPGKITVADGGLMLPSHMTTLGLSKAAGVQLASVHFNGDSEGTTAVLGGHTDAVVGSVSAALAQMKSGALRALATTDTEELAVIAGVKPLTMQGYDFSCLLTRGIAAPGGTPKEIVDKLSAAVKKVTLNPEFAKKAQEGGFVIRPLDATQYAAQWDEQETLVKTMLEAAKTQAN